MIVHFLRIGSLVLLLPLTGCQHAPGVPRDPLRLVRSSGGGMEPMEVVVRWDRQSQVARYEQRSALPGSKLDCTGTTTLHREDLESLLSQIRICQGRVDSIVSDGDADTLILIYGGRPPMDDAIASDSSDGETRIVIRSELGQATEGMQQYSCHGFKDLDRYFKEKIPCL